MPTLSHQQTSQRVVALAFDEVPVPAGFTDSSTAQFDGSCEPIIRELLQNCLDAFHARDDKQSGDHPEALIIIRDVANTDLPGWDAYRQAFVEASEERSRVKKGPGETTVLNRIERAVSRDSNPALICVDNGHGLNGERMDALLSSGMTNKGDGGAGSFGLGHLTAFAASNLRYVLYGSRFKTQGTTQEIVSGHAILATRRGEGDPGVFKSAEGFLRLEDMRLPFNGSDDGYGNSFPEGLPLPHMERSHGRLPWHTTGTMVWITGFNDFNREDSDISIVEAIARAIAINFVVAIHSHEMSVRIVDEREGGRDITLDASTIGKVLACYQNDKRAAQGGGYNNGRAAYNSYLTLTTGTKTLQPNIGTWCIRRLDELDQPRSEVNVFRKGMWISSRVDRLRPSNLDDMRPADVVLCLDDEKERLAKLAREAEGPQHLGLEPRRLDGPQRRELRGLLQQAREWLRSEVGIQQSDQSFTPSEFAEMKWNGQASSRSVQSLRRPSRSVPTGGDDAGAAMIDDDPNPGVNPGQSTGPGRRSLQPAPGKLVHYRAAIKLLSGNCIQARVKFNDNNRNLNYIGIRVKELSPSDASCQRPLGDRYLPLVKVSEASQHTQQDHGPNEAGSEVLIKFQPAVLEVTLTAETAIPIPDADYVEIEIVRRSAPAGDRTT